MINVERILRPRGDVHLEIVKPNRPGRVQVPYPLRALSLQDVWKYGMPHSWLTAEVRRYRLKNFSHLWRGLWRYAVARELGIPFMQGALYLSIIYPSGRQTHLGLVGMRVITTAGVAFIVDAFQGLTSVSSFRFHGLGTSGTAEAIGQTALLGELTTQLNPNSTRATGTLGEGATSGIFVTTGDNLFDESATIAEHGLLSQAAVGGTLFDRTVFTALTILPTLTCRSTYSLTINSGG